jgi:hypothetical protein
MEALDYWRLCDELTVLQAALLVAGVDPATHQFVEKWNAADQPLGYDAAKHAITNALRRGDIAGRVIEYTDYDSFGSANGVIPDTVDPAASRVELDSLRAWLRRRGLKTGFFFPGNDDRPDYLDRSHPRFAPKLAAAVQAWMAVQETAEAAGRSPKQTLVKWLRENAAAVGLTDEEGVVNETGVEEVAKVANWQLTGGAPKTPGNER